MTCEQSVYFNRLARIVMKAEVCMNEAVKSGNSKRAMHCAARYSRLTCLADKFASAEVTTYGPAGKVAPLAG